MTRQIRGVRYCGPTFDGWLTAFMYWDKERTRICEAGKMDEEWDDKKVYKLDGETFPILYQNMRGVPTSVVEVLNG
jgi:hypothetical protein